MKKSSICRFQFFKELILTLLGKQGMHEIPKDFVYMAEKKMRIMVTN
jgi:hypothetical protein